MEEEQIGLCKTESCLTCNFVASCNLTSLCPRSYLVCVGCVLHGHVLPKLAVWSGHWSGFFHPGGHIQDAIVSELHVVVDTKQQDLQTIYIYSRHIVIALCVPYSRNGSAMVQIMATDIYKNPKVYSKV